MSRTIPPWAVVTVPFPYVERNARKARPALNISNETFQNDTGLCWVLMITSAASGPWLGDIPIEDLAEAGLSKPSLVRTAKVALAEVRRLMPIGGIDSPSRRIIREQVLAHLALDT